MTYFRSTTGSRTMAHAPMQQAGRRRRQIGITLIEALIALAVISLGVLAIAKLYGDLIASTAESKARTEAVQVAEQRVDRLRAAMERGEFEALANTGSDTHVGTNATFQIEPTFEWDDVDDQNRLDVLMTVEWDDARGDTQRVNVSSSIAWMDPRTVTNISKGRLSTGDDPIARPTGRATTGDDGRGVFQGELDDAADLSDQERDTLDSLANRIGVEIREQDGSFQVLSDGEPVLTTRNAHLGSISGRVFMDSDSAGNDPDNWFILSSDAAFCDTNFDTSDGESVPFEIDNSTDGVEYFEYVCFFGLGWYGNIGVVTEAGNLSSTVCVGDPEPRPSLGYDDWDSVEAQWSPIRRYRGFQAEEADGEFTGISGLGDTGSRYFSRHDFFHLDKIKGNKPGDRSQACEDTFDDLDGTTQDMISGSGKLVES
ncbi:prepilin-type N-terminal cleavage/methylation domain-containing protein, partial [Roseovarius sp.]|uniref:prepilin-type N-terminal cleavage/methylation domain-containing protein n=1 Tax=Roseovarius sp. TaxID=1486281 RepID=UPI00356B3777